MWQQRTHTTWMLVNCIKNVLTKFTCFFSVHKLLLYVAFLPLKIQCNMKIAQNYVSTVDAYCVYHIVLALCNFMTKIQICLSVRRQTIGCKFVEADIRMLLMKLHTEVDTKETNNHFSTGYLNFIMFLSP